MLSALASKLSITTHYQEDTFAKVRLEFLDSHCYQHDTDLILGDPERCHNQLIALD